MQSINFKLSIGMYLLLTSVVVIFIMILMRDSIFQALVGVTGDSQIQDSQQATKETTDLLLSLDKIKLNTSVLQSSYLQSLTKFPSFPIDAQTLSNFGKLNPFLGNFVVVSDKASSSVGAIVYSNQRSTNSGNSITSVKTPARTTRTVRSSGASR